MPHNPSEFLRNFESIGENCEFGFVLQKYGISDGSMFRWTNIRDFNHLINALDGRLDGLFQAKNLVPCGENLVRDTRYGIEFHTEMAITRGDDQYMFAVPFEERRAIYETENDKVQYLVRKFLEGVARGCGIYVLRGRSPIPIDTAREVLRSIRQHGDATVLIVSRADDANQAGTVRVVQDNLYQSFIRHISADSMDDIDYDGWFEMCEAAWNLHVSLRGSNIITASTPTQQPTELPEWFDAEGYLRANPDVAAAGMDAGEHYLKFGWKEQRTLVPRLGL